MSTHVRARALRRAMLGGVVAATLLALAAPASSAAPSTSASLACGDVVTSDVRLTADLLDCPDHGLVVAADGVTIDLGGRTIDGVGSGFGVRLGSAEGGFDDVTITNGTIREFQNGVDLEVSHRTTVSQVRLHANAVYGVVAGYETTGTRITRSHLTDNGFAGVRVQHAADTVVERNTVVGNGRDGISVAMSERTTVTRNTLSGHRDTGIDVWETSGDRIERNIARDGETDGIVVDAALDAVVAHNTAAGNGFAGFEIDFGSDGTVVAGNRALGNGRDGFTVWGEGATLSRNVATANGEHGFAVHFAEDAEPSVDGGGNRAAGNGLEDCVGLACR